MGDFLAGLTFAVGLAGVFGWCLRGWYERRLRPWAILDKETTGRIGKRWGESLANLKDRQS